MVKELSAGEFKEFTKEGLVMIDFFADWCMPCMMMSPIIDDMAEQFEGRVKIAKVDIGENESIAKEFGISSIPAFVFIKDGKVVSQEMGAMAEEDLEEKLNEFSK